MRKNLKLGLRLWHKRLFVKNLLSHRLQTLVYRLLSGKQDGKKKHKSPKMSVTDGRVMVAKSRTSKRLKLTKMVTLERVSQIFEKIHCNKPCEEDCSRRDSKLLNLEEKVVQAANILNKVANRIEDDWQNSSTEDLETYKQLYSDLTLVTQTFEEDADLAVNDTATTKALRSSIKRVMNALADAIEFECISSEVSNVLSAPFTEEEIEKADAAIARLTTEVSLQRHSPEEIWERFDAVRDRGLQHQIL